MIAQLPCFGKSVHQWVDRNYSIHSSLPVVLWEPFPAEQREWDFLGTGKQQKSSLFPQRSAGRVHGESGLLCSKHCQGFYSKIPQGKINHQPIAVLWRSQTDNFSYRAWNKLILLINFDHSRGALTLSESCNTTGAVPELGSPTAVNPAWKETAHLEPRPPWNSS